MTNPMTPPPLPGWPVAAPPIAAVPAPAYPAPAYPAPAQAAPPAPQGYPGPAVASAAPAAAPGYPAPAAAYPAPAPYPAPQAAPPAYPPPGYPPQAAPPGYPPQAATGYSPQAAPPAYPPAGYPQGQFATQGHPGQQYMAPMSVADIGDAIAGATGGDRAPKGEPGSYTLEIKETICTRHPQKPKLTFKATFRVLTSNNPSFPAGSEIVYIEGLDYESKAKRVQDFLIAGQGYPSKAVYDQTLVAAGHDPGAQIKLFGNAAGNPSAQIPGNAYPPNPLKGRIVSAIITRETKIAGPQSARAGQPVTYDRWVFTPGPTAP